MPFPAYTRDDLAEFTGRPAVSFPEYAEGTAIPQALLLFKLGTCLSSVDHLTPDQAELMKYAILSMADSIHLSAPYQAALASPFNSESIGSYSYSKTARAVQRGDETGVMWFDLAMDQLSICDRVSGAFQRGGIEVFEHDGQLTDGQVSGNSMYLTPAEVDLSTQYGHDPRFGITLDRF